MPKLISAEFYKPLEDRANTELRNLGFDNVLTKASPGDGIAEVFVITSPTSAAPGKEELVRMAFKLRKALNGDYQLGVGPIQSNPGSVHFTIKNPKPG